VTHLAGIPLLNVFDRPLRAGPTSPRRSRTGYWRRSCSWSP
jgi:hypothetical protein